MVAIPTNAKTSDALARVYTTKITIKDTTTSSTEGQAQ